MPSRQLGQLARALNVAFIRAQHFVALDPRPRSLTHASIRWQQIASSLRMNNAQERSQQSSDGASRRQSIQPLVVVACAMAAGVITDRHWPLTMIWWWSIAGGTWCGWWWARRLSFNRIAALALLLSVFAATAGWHHWHWYLFSSDNLGLVAREASQPVVVEAVATNSPRHVPAPKPNPLHPVSQGEETRIQVDIVALRDGMRWRTASGRAQLFVDGQLPGIRTGDRLRIQAQLLKPRPGLNPGSFDLWSHQRSDRILCRLYANFPDCVQVVKRKKTNGVVPTIQNLRSYCSKMLWNELQHERRGLAAAVLLGAREQVDRERVEDFVVTGTIHLFAISGLHVGMMAGGLFLVMRLGLLPKWVSLLTVVACISMYALLTDARPPVIRASLLVALLCFSMLAKRRFSAHNALAAAAILVMLLNPADLFRTGVQLSFLAVLGLSWCSSWWTRSTPADPLDKLIEESYPQLWVWSRQRLKVLVRCVATTTAIWLLALPLVMDRFHIFSPVAIGLNMVLWIPMSLTLFSGFGLLVTGWLFPWLANIFAWVCDWNLWILESCVRSARNIPGSHLWVAGPSDWWLWGFYGGLGCLALFPQIRPPIRWCCALLSIWLGVGFVSSWQNQSSQQDTLRCTFVSVGHGTSAVLELPSGKTLLYDAGTLGAPIAGTRSISAYLWSQGIHHLDAVVLSHADIDHYNALPDLLKRFDVGAVYYSPLMFSGKGVALEPLRQAVDEAGSFKAEIHQGHTLATTEGVKIEILHPPAGGVGGSDNANSIVLDVSYQGKSILLPGDLEPPGMKSVTSETPRRFDLVMAPHHGSIHSDPEKFAKWTNPKWVVISSGHGHDISQVERVYRNQG
ncbi:MAG: ComEC/Rec2 family competence protein, partial [Pirellulaceae bacterium]|nr:ComEC/Rec2 family competence protein [Pirellulaceae bacterium]